MKWEYDPLNDYHNIGDKCYVSDNNCEVVCQVVGDKRKEHAALIAAAPDLLEALIDVRDNVQGDSPEMWARVNAAIARATLEA